MHGDLRRQRMVRAREEHELFAARELPGGRIERLIEAGAEIDRDVGDGRGLDGAGQAERLIRGLSCFVDADVLTAARARELREELVTRIRPRADREEASARAGERTTEAIEERLGAGLPGRGGPVADVDDRRLLFAVQARERGLEHRAEVGGAAHRMIAELLERLRDVAFRGGREAVLRVDDGGRDIERDEREVISIAERTKRALRRGDAQLS